MKSAFENIFTNRTVLITGHTGFKGTWLALWLHELGANVVGFSIDPPTQPNLFSLTGLGDKIIDVRGDVREAAALHRVLTTYQPEIVLHLAAQSQVLPGYRDPITTFETNVNGTINVLEAVRATPAVKVCLCITTYKVYEDQGYVWGYREDDRLGEHDPYGASKAMAELAAAAYRQSFFSPQNDREHNVALATVRATNVIGGGDFADFRLVPDCMRALLAGEPICLRTPHTMRHWQHVLEPLSGYLWLVTRLLQNGPAYAEAWNFGPSERVGVTAQAVAEKAIELWGSGRWQHIEPEVVWKESTLLTLNWDKAARRLGWQPVYTWEQALAITVDWFKAYQEQADLYAITAQQIQTYTHQARHKNLPWAQKDPTVS